MIVRVQRVVATLLQPHDFQRHVGDNLVRVHVGGGARAALNHIDHELIVEFSGDQRVAGFDDWLGELSVERAEFYVGTRSRFFDEADGTNQVGHRRDHGARYREIFNCARRVHAPVGAVGNKFFAQKIVFDAVAG